MVAWSFSASLEHSSRPCASVVGAGGAVAVGLAVVLEVPLTAIEAEAVVLAGALLADVIFVDEVVDGVVLVGVVTGGVKVVVTVVAATGFEELDNWGELPAAGATARARVGMDDGDASTPVKVGVGDALTTTAAFEVPADDCFAFWITRKPRPMSTMTAATITLTRRSQ